ncbi:serine hydrolase FSH [Pyronema omphalodes]|nr:serine hydrolase FSH [Pyronema omphalodes]
MASPINLLFLHGYTQSGTSFSAKTKAVQKTLQKMLGPATTMHFPTGPVKLELADIPGFSGQDSTAAETENQEAYAWWRRNDATGEYIHLPETWKYLSDYLDTHGPFTGVIGFSQGAALAAMLVSILERPNRPETFTTKHPQMKFAVCYSGFRAPKQYDSWYEPKIVTPVLHVIGSLDTVVDEGRSLELVKACEGGDEKTVYHPGGHYLPASKNMVMTLAGFIKQYSEEQKTVEDDDDFSAFL